MLKEVIVITTRKLSHLIIKHQIYEAAHKTLCFCHNCHTKLCCKIIKIFQIENKLLPNCSETAVFSKFLRHDSCEFCAKAKKLIKSNKKKSNIKLFSVKTLWIFLIYLWCLGWCALFNKTSHKFCNHCARLSLFKVSDELLSIAILLFTGRKTMNENCFVRFLRMEEFMSFFWSFLNLLEEDWAGIEFLIHFVF